MIIKHERLCPVKKSLFFYAETAFGCAAATAAKSRGLLDEPEGCCAGCADCVGCVGCVGCAACGEAFSDSEAAGAGEGAGLVAGAAALADSSGSCLVLAGLGGAGALRIAEKLALGLASEFDSA